MEEVKRFAGTGVALVTPMAPDGAVDWEKFSEHVEFQIAGGVNYLVPCGTTGEGATLTPVEQSSVIRRAVEVSAGRVPVMAGAGSNSTSVAVELAKQARKSGAEAILSVSPFYNKPTQEGLFLHYREISQGIDCPLLLYNVPGRTGSNVLPETVLRLAKRNLIAGVKEASGDLSQIQAVISGRKKAGLENFLIISGDDSLAVPLIEFGGDGVISVAANEVPKIFSEMVQLALQGDFEKAWVIHHRLSPLMEANFLETNPIPVKTALDIMGHFKAHMRLPLTPLGPGLREPLQEALRKAGVQL